MEIATFEASQLDHRPILQYIISVKTIAQRKLAKFFVTYYLATYNTEEARNVISNLNNHEIYELLEAKINDINMKLLPMNYEIKKHKEKMSASNDNDNDNDIYFSFINLVEDTPSKLNTDYSAEDIKAITFIIKSCIENGELKGQPYYYIGSSEALNEYRKQTGKLMAMGQTLFQSLINNGWLRLNKAGQYVLGLRLLAELESQLFGVGGNGNGGSTQGA